jgi:cobalt-precorrin 5A hydrolase
VVGDKTMSTRIVIGVGYRLGSSANAIEALVRHALDRTPPAERLGVFTIEDKNTESGLIAAAHRLGLELVFLTQDALREQAPFVQTRSIGSETRFGVPSVAEAAALAGAGAGGVLILPRIVSQGVTCAIAQSRDNPP